MIRAHPGVTRLPSDRRGRRRSPLRRLLGPAIGLAVAVDLATPGVRRLAARAGRWQDAWIGRPADRIDQRAVAAAWGPVPLGTWCLRCGRVAGESECLRPGRPCGEGCRAIGDAVTVLGADAAPLDGWIRAVKRSGGDHAAGWWLGTRLGQQLAATGLLEGDGRPLVVPVPGVAPRRAGRGIDHTAVLAGGVAAACRGRVTRGVLRHAGGERQAGRTRFERLMTAPEVIRRGRGRLPLGATVILVDDIRTTGATLRASVDRLREAGAGTVLVAVVASRDRSTEASDDHG